MVNNNNLYCLYRFLTLHCIRNSNLWCNWFSPIYSKITSNRSFLVTDSASVSGLIGNMAFCWSSFWEGIFGKGSSVTFINFLSSRLMGGIYMIMERWCDRPIVKKICVCWNAHKVFVEMPTSLIASWIYVLEKWSLLLNWNNVTPWVIVYFSKQAP